MKNPALAYGEALKIIGGLSRPSKMPWFSWSVSAAGCITGAKLAKIEGTTCSTCYALKGRYRMPNVVDAMDRREQGMEHPRWVEAFIVALKEAHAMTRSTYKARNGRTVRENRFRWFDSGDLRSLVMLERIAEIARRTPKIRHWLPTREHAIVRSYLAKHGKFPRNLVVRLSTPLLGEAPKRQPFGLPWSAVDYDGAGCWKCPAKQQGGFCLDCSRCWGVDNVAYYKH